MKACLQVVRLCAVPVKTTAGRWVWGSGEGLVMVIRGQLLPARLQHSSVRCMHRCRDGIASNCSKSLHVRHTYRLYSLDLLEFNL